MTRIAPALLLGLLAAPAAAQIDLPGQGGGPQQTETPPGQSGGTTVEPTNADSVNATPIYTGPVEPIAKKNPLLKFGGEGFLQMFPMSSDGGHLSIHAGARLIGGYSIMKMIRATGLLSLGFALDDRADAATMMGLGAEADFETLLPKVTPFARLSYEFTLYRSNFARPANSLALTAGVRFLRTMSAYLLLGGDYYGGVTVGLGFAAGFF